MYRQSTTTILSQEYRLDIWRALYSLILYGVESMPSCLMFKVTLRHPELYPYPLHNDSLGRFLDSFKKPFERDGVKLLCFWVKEFGDESEMGNFHYHIWFAVDGHVIRNPFSLKRRIEYLWSLAIGHPAEGLANIDAMNVPGSYTPHGIMVRRNSSDYRYQMHHVWEQAQYLAKTKSKKCYPFKGDAFSSSQVPQMSSEEANRKLLEVMPGW